MKYSILLLGFFLIAITFTACKTEDEKRAQLLTENYVRLVDSITDKSAEDAAANWRSIEQYYETKTEEINFQIDKLDDNHDYDAKIDSAIAKYESFKNKIFLKKLRAQSSTD